MRAEQILMRVKSVDDGVDSEQSRKGAVATMRCQLLAYGKKGRMRIGGCADQRCARDNGVAKFSWAYPEKGVIELGEDRMEVEYLRKSALDNVDADFSWGRKF